jgi:hypothetical protein
VNLTVKLKQNIVKQFKSGVPIETIARCCDKPLRRIEQVIREALRAQDGMGSGTMIEKVPDPDQVTP